MVNTKIGSVAGTSHHLNVTIGENEKFYHTSNNDGQIIVPRQVNMPFDNQSQSTAGVKIQRSHLIGNDYIGLMSQRSKQGTSVEFV